jgi:hypothetical protein
MLQHWEYQMQRLELRHGSVVESPKPQLAILRLEQC